MTTAEIGVRLCGLKAWDILFWPVRQEEGGFAFTGWTLNTAPVMARPLDALDMILASRYISLASTRGYAVLAQQGPTEGTVMLCMAQLFGGASPLMDAMTAAQGMGISSCVMQTARWTGGTPVIGTPFQAFSTISGYKDPFIGGLSRVLDIVNTDNATIDTSPKLKESP